MAKDFFATCDVKNTNSLYGEIYEKTEEIGFMGKYVSGGDTTLPNPTQHKRFISDLPFNL